MCFLAYMIEDVIQMGWNDSFRCTLNKYGRMWSFANIFNVLRLQFIFANVLNYVNYVNLEFFSIVKLGLKNASLVIWKNSAQGFFFFFY